jgi:hypothetical protein
MNAALRLSFASLNLEISSNSSYGPGGSLHLLSLFSLLVRPFDFQPRVYAALIIFQ